MYKDQSQTQEQKELIFPYFLLWYIKRQLKESKGKTKRRERIHTVLSVPHCVCLLHLVSIKGSLFLPFHYERTWLCYIIEVSSTRTWKHTFLYWYINCAAYWFIVLHAKCTFIALSAITRVHILKSYLLTSCKSHHTSQLRFLLHKDMVPAAVLTDGHIDRYITK